MNWHFVMVSRPQTSRSRRSMVVPFLAPSTLKQQKREAEAFVCSVENTNRIEILHFAVDRQYRELLEYTLEKMKKKKLKPDALDNRGMAAIHMAIMNRDIHSIHTLLDNGAATHVGYKPALHLAINKADAEIASELLRALPRCVDDEYRPGQSLLHRAVDSRSPELIKILIQAGAPVDAVNSGGRTPPCVRRLRLWNPRRILSVRSWQFPPPKISPLLISMD